MFMLSQLRSFLKSVLISRTKQPVYLSTLAGFVTARSNLAVLELDRYKLFSVLDDSSFYEALQLTGLYTGILVQISIADLMKNNKIELLEEPSADCDVDIAIDNGIFSAIEITSSDKDVPKQQLPITWQVYRQYQIEFLGLVSTAYEQATKSAVHGHKASVDEYMIAAQQFIKNIQSMDEYGEHSACIADHHLQAAALVEFARESKMCVQRMCCRLIKGFTIISAR